MNDDPTDPDPFGDKNPFEGIPLFGDLARIFRQQGDAGWDAARQVARSVATDGASEPNVDPAERIRIENLSRVAELQVANATGLQTSQGTGPARIVPMTRTRWVERTLEDYQPLFDQLGSSLGRSGKGGTGGTSAQMDMTDEGDPLNWMAPLFDMIAPMLLRTMTGSMVGNLARRSFGQYDLPIPRRHETEIMVVASNVSQFGSEWSLDEDDLVLWVCIHELTHHAVLGIPHVAGAVNSLLSGYMSGFETVDSDIESRLGDLELFDPTDADPRAGLARFAENPEVLLGAIQSPAQAELLPKLNAIITAIVGYVDHTMDQIGHRLISSYPMVTEALRRRRVEASRADRLVERFLGLDLTQERYERGSAFVEGIVERAGTQGLARLWESAETLPTPAEIEAPGLWLTRIDLPLD